MDPSWGCGCVIVSGIYLPSTGWFRHTEMVCYHACHFLGATPIPPSSPAQPELVGRLPLSEMSRGRRQDLVIRPYQGLSVLGRPALAYRRTSIGGAVQLLSESACHSEHRGRSCVVARLPARGGRRCSIGPTQANPSNGGRVPDTVVRRCTCHRDCFGNASQSCANYLSALAPGGWWSVSGLIIMTALFLRVSGATSVDKPLAATKLAFKDYRVSARSFRGLRVRQPKRSRQCPRGRKHLDSTSKRL